MRYNIGEPVSPSLYEFQFVQTSPFFSPAPTCRHRLYLIDQRLFHPCGGSIPLNVVNSALQMDGSRPTIQAKTPPIPELEGKNKRRRTDLKYQAAGTGAMYGPRRNQKVIVFFCRPLVHIAFCVEVNPVILS